MGWWSNVDWGSVIGAVGSVYAADRAADGARDAGRTAARGSEAATQLAREMFQYQQQINQPFLQSQQNALNAYNRQLGLAGQQPPDLRNFAPDKLFEMRNGVPVVNQTAYANNPAYRQAWDTLQQQHKAKFGHGFTTGTGADALTKALTEGYAKAADPFASFRNTPGYQFGLEQGMGAIQSSAAAGGGLLSGKTLKALQKFGTDYADQQGYTPYMNRLASAAGIGQTNAVSNLQNASGNFAQGAGGFMQNAANARATGMTNAANARYQGISDAAGFLGQWYGGRG